MVSIIIVNYKSADLLNSCLDSICAAAQSDQSAHQIELVIINNDAEKLAVSKRYPFNVRIVDSGNNVGFGRANNNGAKIATGDFLFFLNPDTEMVPGTLEKMVNHLENKKQVGIIGPRILLKNQNRPQPWTCGQKTSINSILFKNTFNKPWNKNIVQSVDWVSGTALMIRTILFKELGGFDEDFFMYFEDQDLCVRAKNNGSEICFFPQACILHLDGKSWDDACQKKNAYYRSQELFFSKHYGPIKTSFLKLIRFVVKGM